MSATSNAHAFNTATERVIHHVRPLKVVGITWDPVTNLARTPDVNEDDLTGVCLVQFADGCFGIHNITVTHGRVVNGNIDLSDTWYTVDPVNAMREYTGRL